MKKVRWDYWKRQKSWTLWQAACLLCSIEPPANEEEFKKLLPTNEKLRMIFEDSCKAAESGELKTLPPLNS